MSVFLSLPFTDVVPSLTCFKRQFWERDHALSQESFYPWFQSCFYFDFNTKEFLRQLQLCTPETEFILSGAEHLLRQASSRVLVRTSLQSQPKERPASLSFREKWCRELSAEQITLCHYRSIQIPLDHEKEYEKVAKKLKKLGRSKAMQGHHDLLLRWSKTLRKICSDKEATTKLYFLHEIIEKGNSADLLTHLEDLSESQRRSRTKTCMRFLFLVYDTIKKYLHFCSKKWNQGRGCVYMNLDWKFLNFIVDIRNGGDLRVRLTDIFPGGAHCYPVECFQRDFKVMLARCEYDRPMRTRLSATLLLVSVLTSAHEIDRYHGEHSQHRDCDASCSGKHPECIMLCIVEALFVCLTQMASRCGQTLPVFLQSLLDVILACVVERCYLQKESSKRTHGLSAREDVPSKVTDLLETLFHYGVKVIFNSKRRLQYLFLEIKKEELAPHDPVVLRAKKKRWLALLCLQLLRCPSCRVFPSWVSLFFQHSDLHSSKAQLLRCDPPKHTSSRETKSKQSSNRKAYFISLKELKENRTKHGVLTQSYPNRDTYHSHAQNTCLQAWNPSLLETGMMSALSQSLPSYQTQLVPVQQKKRRPKNVWKQRGQHGRRGTSAPSSC